MYRAPLSVHLVWHPRFDRGTRYGRAVFAHLFEDPDDLGSHGLRIPVFHWRSTGERGADVPPPGDLPLATAERAVVMPLVDEHLLGAIGWDTFLRRTARAMRPDDLLVPVQLIPGLAPLDDNQPIHLEALPERLRLPRLLNDLTHRLCVLLAPTSGVPAFISYATADGTHIAKRVSAFLAGGGKVEAFFAPRDVPRGGAWREELRRQASRGVLVAIRTDSYASREWCQTEVLEAKRAGMPVVVLDALARREARGFPYLGNGPVIRWRSRDPELLLEQLLSAMLREALRFRYFRLRVEGLSKFRRIELPMHVQPAPPELLTSIETAPAPLLVYPDPPLGPDELSIIRRVERGPEPVTPLMLLAS